MGLAEMVQAIRDSRQEGSGGGRVWIEYTVSSTGFVAQGYPERGEYYIFRIQEDGNLIVTLCAVDWERADMCAFHFAIAYAVLLRLTEPGL